MTKNSIPNTVRMQKKLLEFEDLLMELAHLLQNDPIADQGVAESDEQPIEQLKTLQRVQSISPVPEAIPVLRKAELTSAYDVVELPPPPAVFVQIFAQTIGETKAERIYALAKTIVAFDTTESD